MRLVAFVFVGAALALTACGPRPQQEAGTESGTTPYEEVTEEPAPAELPEVDAALLAAPDTEFTAIEPSEVGVFAAPTVMAALESILGGEAHVEDASLSLTIREQGENAVADIVRTNMADDSVSAGHLRIEFHQETDGWYPVTAYRRSRCARGVSANQWTKDLCP